MSDQYCPYLGLVGGDRGTARSAPDPDHRCYAQRPSRPVDAAHQRSYCLAASYTECSRYAAAEREQPEPAPADDPTGTRRPSRLLAALPWVALVAALLVVGAVYARDLLQSSLAAAPLVVALSVTPANAPTATPVTPLDPAVAQPTAVVAAEATATSEPGGGDVTLQPANGDTGWWSFGDGRTQHLDDSYLYAGYFEDKAIISAVRFDLSRIRRAAPIQRGTLTLRGLNGDRLGSAGGAWSVQFLDPAALPDAITEGGPSLATMDFQTLYNAPAAVSLFPTLFPADLKAGSTNTFPLDGAARAWLEKQILDGVPAVIARITGPGGGDALFAWDGGTGPQTAGYPPQLSLRLGAPPATPPPLPTDQVIVATLTPTPGNVLTAAAQAYAATTVATQDAGAPTPLIAALATPTAVPENVETVQAIRYAAGLPPLVIYTPAPANSATATADAAFATAVAMMTGTFTPVPTDAVTPIVGLPTPIAENVATAAAQLMAATSAAAERGAPTPLPFGAVIATITPDSPVVASTSTPANAATAQARRIEATAVAMTTGTFTPVPRNARTPTPGPTETPLPLIVAITPQPTPTLTATPPGQAPRQLVGQILFKSDRQGPERLYALDPATGKLYWITQEWPFDVAQAAEGRSADGKRSAEVQTVTEITSTDPYTGQWTGSRSTAAIFVRDAEYQRVDQITSQDRFSYDPAWSPADDWIAFVSPEGGNDEIFMIRPDGSDQRRLTTNIWEWDKHPSWSPDGSQIVFWSNRESGRRQLWVMNADGSNQRKLLDSPYNEWDPIWVK